MRIAVFHNLPPGGGLRALRALLERTSRVHTYELFTIDLGHADRWRGLPGRDLSAAVRTVHRYPLTRVPSPGRLAQVSDIEQVIRIQRRIASDIDDRGFDLAFVHHEQYTSSPALLERLHTPSVYYCQEPRRRSFEFAAARPQARGLTAFGWDLYEHLLRRRDARSARSAGTILANSWFSAENILRAYDRASTVCHLGADGEVFSPAGLPRRRAVVAVGALDPMKCHDLAVEAVARVPAARRPSLELVYERGTDAQATALRELARRHSVELHLHRGISDRALAEIYGTASATLCLAKLEPFGLTSIESLSCGTPVAAVREGGYREVVEDGVNGLVVSRDVAELADAIDRLCSEGSRWSNGQLRGTVMPYWSWDAAAARLCEALAHCAKPGIRPIDLPARAAV